MDSLNKLLGDASELLWNPSINISRQPELAERHDSITVSLLAGNARLGGANYRVPKGTSNPRMGRNIHFFQPETWEEWPTAAATHTGEPPIPGLQAVSLIVQEIGDVDYDLIQPIPIRIAKDEDSGWVATFPEGRIGMPGNSISDAREALLGELVDSFELLSTNRDRLGPTPREQLEALERYIRRQ